MFPGEMTLGRFVLCLQLYRVLGVLCKEKVNAKSDVIDITIKINRA